MGASWILRTGAAAVTAVALTLLLASGGGAGGVKEGGTLRVVEAGLFNTIDPALIRHIPEGIILRAACAGLVGLPHKPLPEGLRVVPELAETLPRVSRDGKTYTFTIRKDARFSDGRPVTAQHFLPRARANHEPRDVLLAGSILREDRRLRGDAGGQGDETDGSRRAGSHADHQADAAHSRLPAPAGRPGDDASAPSPRRCRWTPRARRPRWRARRPTTSPSSCPGSASCSSATASTAGRGRTISTASSGSSASASGSSTGSWPEPPTTRSGRRASSRRTRARSHAGTASTRRSSSSPRRRGSGCSPSTRAGRSSRATSSSARRSTSPSTAAH